MFFFKVFLRISRLYPPNEGSLAVLTGQGTLCGIIRVESGIIGNLYKSPQQMVYPNL